MTLNAVIRCSSCNRVSPKSGSKNGICKWCLEIEILNKRLGSNQLSCEKEIERLKNENIFLKQQSYNQTRQIEQLQYDLEGK